jgi:hypothetical protein
VRCGAAMEALEATARDRLSELPDDLLHRTCASWRRGRSSVDSASSHGVGGTCG